MGEVTQAIPIIWVSGTQLQDTDKLIYHSDTIFK